MQIRIKKDGNKACVFFEGELDESCAAGVREMLDGYFAGEDLSGAVFDLKKLTFTDSTGIGVFIGRYKKLKARGVPVYFKNVGPHIEKIFKATGLFSIMPRIEEA